MRRVRVRRREGERRMKIAPLAARCACGPHARCACGRTGPAALAPLFRDNIRATTMTTAATPPTAAMELHTTAMIISVRHTRVTVGGSEVLTLHSYSVHRGRENYYK